VKTQLLLHVPKRKDRKKPLYPGIEVEFGSLVLVNLSHLIEWQLGLAGQKLDGSVLDGLIEVIRHRAAAIKNQASGFGRGPVGQGQ
jgi:hypothetical protein